ERGQEAFRRARLVRPGAVDRHDEPVQSPQRHHAPAGRRDLVRDRAMTGTTDTLSVSFERELPHPPEKVWRALTEPRLIEQWLMKNDFQPIVGHRFKLTADWGTVECEVRAIE